jgi:putative MATE family efflux protein
MVNNAALSIRENKRRELILHGNLWKTVLWITTPLAIYALFNYLYGFIDFLLVSLISSDDVAAIFFVDDIKGAISAIGGGIAIGGAVFVARNYGAGDFDSARKYAAQTLIMATIVSGIFAAIMMIFAVPILKLLNAPQAIIDIGLGYYLVQMFVTIIIAVNSVYMGIERSKGNTTMVMLMNVVAIVIKLIFSLLFILVFNKGTIYVAIATLIAQAFLMILGMIILFSPKNSIAIRGIDLSIDLKMMKSIMWVALPVIGGKFLFSLGRVIVNGIAAVYGTLAIAAFGLASKLVGSAGAVAVIFEESVASISSQNIGAGNLKRAFKTYGVANILSVLIGFIGMGIIVLSVDKMIPWFTSNSSPEFAALIKSIFNFEKFSIVTGATAGIVAGVFIGFKITKVTLILNVIRIYVFRIPALLLLLHFGVGPIALGYVMFISNTGTAIVALFLIFMFYRRVRNFGYLDMRLMD